MSLLCFGEALVDLLSNGKNPEQFTKYSGGAPANVAVAYAKLGGKASFCGMLGHDMFGRFITKSLNQYQVSTYYCHYTQEAKTALAFVSLDEKGERSFEFYRPPAADLLFLPEHFSAEAFVEHDMFHICSNSLTESSIYQSTLAGLKLAKQFQCLTSFDINLRKNLWNDTRFIHKRLWDALAFADVVKFSQEELAFMMDDSKKNLSEQDVIGMCFDLGVRVVLVTNAGRPIQLHTPEGCMTVTPPNVDVVDTTAAGDAFMGGFLWALSQEKHPPLSASLHDIEHAVSFASHCGAWSVTKQGAFPSLPMYDDVAQQL